MAPLNVVCLISGGKDSLFSILHCLQNGHNVVALANLHPPATTTSGANEDLDSYMYQTVGYKVIPLYEEALGLPLYRQEIAGSAVNQSKHYGQAAEKGSQDETEDLVPLLLNVKSHHPEMNAVSTGAILSDYQRTRVESVAVRLGLTPLSFLWQWPNLPPHSQTTLLEDMSTAGQDSRIIKVASGGLDSSFLWCNVADPRTMHRIEKAVKRFGSGDDGAVLGEGGEYETLAVAGPSPLWKGRIEIADDQRKTLVGEAGSASVSIAGALVAALHDSADFVGVRTPPLLEPQFEELLKAASEADAEPAAQLREQPSPSTTLPDHVCYQGLRGPAGKPVAEQMAAIMDKKALSTLLHLQNPPLDLSDIAYVSIVLRNMADFAAVNAVYTAAFTEPNPPARVTIAEPSVLEDRHVMVSFTCVRDSAASRQGLHVQSQSYWAPANIGPYSQAISAPTSGGEADRDQRVVYIAGQIPLAPASMELVTANAAGGDMTAFVMQAVLAAQHFVRIGRAMQVRRWACGIAFVTAVSKEDAAAKARMTRLAWEGLHKLDGKGGDLESDEDDGEAFDVWDVKHGAQRRFGAAKELDQDDTDAAAAETGALPRLEVVQVEALPRGASIEWATYGLTANGGATPKIPHFEHLVEMFRDRVVPS